MDDDPFSFVVKTVCDTGGNTRLYLTGLLHENPDDIQVGWNEVKNCVLNSASSRRISYRTIMNPALAVHPLYQTNYKVSELHRSAFTRFRVSALSLAVEVGRWSRRGRGYLPLAERVCTCGDVQTEEHVIQFCPLTQHIRDIYQISTIHELCTTQANYALLCKIVWDVLQVYRN